MDILTDTPAAVSGSEHAQIRALRQLLQKGAVKLLSPDGRAIDLPGTVRDLLDQILTNMLAGKVVCIVPEHGLTTQRAANLLGVSRPFMVRLLEEGKLPFHMVGSHRRVYVKDLQAYKKRRDEERHESINRMARMESEAGTYDTKSSSLKELKRDETGCWIGQSPFLMRAFSFRLHFP